MSFKVPWAGILGLLFITLKLTGHIDWAWLWVLSPLWIPVVVLTLIVGFAMTVASIVGR